MSDRRRRSRSRSRSRGRDRRRSSGWDENPLQGMANPLLGMTNPLLIGASDPSGMFSKNGMFSANPELGFGALSAGLTASQYDVLGGGHSGGSMGTSNHPLQDHRPVIQKPVAGYASRNFAGAIPTLGMDKPGTDYKLGYMSHIFLEKGYSLMTTRSNHVVLISKNIIEPDKLVINEPAAIRCQMKQDHEGHDEGQLYGIAPLYRSRGDPRAGIPIEFGDFHGIVKQEQKNGDCFVDCDEVKAQYEGRDAYVHSSVVQGCELEEGDGICFNIHLSKAGFPQVPKPVWVRAKRGAGQMRGDFDQEIFFGWVTEVAKETSSFHSNTHGKVVALKEVVSPELLNVGELVAFCVKSRGVNNWVPSVEPPVMKFCGHQGKSSWACFGEYIGKINDSASSCAEIAAGKGAYLHCQTISEQFGRDVFAHTAVLAECGLVAGDILSFNVHINKKGWPQLTAPVWKVISPERAGQLWVKCDKIKKECVQKLPNAAATTPMWSMEKSMVHPAPKSKGKGKSGGAEVGVGFQPRGGYQVGMPPQRIDQMAPQPLPAAGGMAALSAAGQQAAISWAGAQGPTEMWAQMKIAAGGGYDRSGWYGGAWSAGAGGGGGGTAVPIGLRVGLGLASPEEMEERKKYAKSVVEMVTYLTGLKKEGRIF